jgi:flagellar motor switch protein FliN/FliY
VGGESTVSKKLSQAEIDALIASMLAGELQEAANQPAATPATPTDNPAPPPGQQVPPSDGAAAAGTAQAAAVMEAPAAEAASGPRHLGPITQAEVDAALRAAGRGSLASTPEPAPVGVTPPPSPAQAGAAKATAGQPDSAAAPQPPGGATQATPFPFPMNSLASQILLDLELTLTAEVVRTRMKLSQLLGLAPGAVIELERPANEPVDIIINGIPLMKAKVVTIGEHYGVQITESRLKRAAS